MNDKIIQTVCRIWNVNYADVCSKQKHRTLFFARMSIACFLRQYTPLSTTEIGRLINRDHSTIMYYLRIYDSELHFNEVFRNFAKSIEDSLLETIKSPLTLELEDEFNEIRG